jgi:ABC-2 type transport system permease protein
MMKNTFVLTGRLVRHILRSPDTIITVTLMPIMMLLLFVYVFGGAIASGAENYVNYIVPGVLLMTILSGTSYTSMRLFMDKQKGLTARFHSMPIGRSSVLWAHVLISLVSNLISVAIVVAVALVVGFRASGGVWELLAAFGILTLFTLALTWLAVIPGLKSKSAEGSYAYSYPLIFLPYISSAFVPTATMPEWLRIFAENQPITSLVETLRNLLGGVPTGGEIWTALLWCAGLGVAAYVVAMWVYMRK